MPFRLPRLRLRNPVIPRLRYAPSPDGRPDPGEVVWTWVPYEDDPSQGKDRPVLVIGEEGDRLLALPLTSRDHDRRRRPGAPGRSGVDGHRHGRVGRATTAERGAPEPAAADRPCAAYAAREPPSTAAVFDAVLAAARPYL